jgi:hypothetical protein
MKLEPITAYKGGTKTKIMAQGMSTEHVADYQKNKNKIYWRNMCMKLYYWSRLAPATAYTKSGAWL